MPIPKHPLGDVLLKMNVSHSAKGANWLHWGASGTPRQVDLGLSHGDMVRMSYEMYRVVDRQSGPVNFNPPPPASNTWAPAFAMVAAKALQLIGPKLSYAPHAPDGFEFQNDGTFEPAGSRMIDSDQIRDGIELLGKTGVFKKLFGHRRHLYCAFVEEPVRPAWPQMTPVEADWVRKMFPNPADRLDIQICRLDYSDYVVCSRR